MLYKVISGGQTGADIGGVIAAKRAGLETGGTMPKTFRTLKGPRPEYAGLYGMKEHAVYAYPPRTECNVKDSDGTICFASNWTSPGELLTSRLITQYKRPSFRVDVLFPRWHGDAAQWITDNDIKVLNVAGNSEETSHGIQKFVEQFMEEVFRGLGIGRSTQAPS